MHIDIKKKLIEEKMYALKGAKREKFRNFLLKEFSDDDIKELTHTNADKILAFLARI
jgi:wobble nucleotide-excising tRNase